ncbi:MAG: copper transporter [Actinomycetota bacterium]|nr:copper transporter [Actinomycetota bacterium]
MSLTAVFLALAVGVVLGTTALKGPVLNNLKDRVSGLATENKGLRNDLRDLRTQSGKTDAFAEEVAPALLPGRLTGKTVTVVSGPGVSTDGRDAVVTELALAGAKVVSRVRLAGDFTDPKRSAEIKALVSQLLPPGVQVPETTEGSVQAGALLGAVLVKGKDSEVRPASSSAVVAGFQSLGLMSFDGKPDTADLAVFMSAPPLTGSANKPRNAAMLGLVSEFDKLDRATVVAGVTAKGDGNIIAAVRSDDAIAKRLSTVDDVNLAAGRVAVVLALAAEANGVTGQYGIGSGATSRVPPLTS